MVAVHLSMTGLSMTGFVATRLNEIDGAVFLGALDALVIGVLIAMFAALVLRVSRKQSAAARFAVWFSALAAIAVLPWLDGELRLSVGAHGHRAANAAALTVPSSWAIYFLASWSGLAAIALARVAT